MHHLITFAAIAVPFLCGMVAINAVSHWLGGGE
jgi:hypothetical protein